MANWAFWRDALERAVKTFAQSLVALLSAGGFGLLHSPWLQSLDIAALAGVLSLLTSVAGTNVGPSGTPSIVTSAGQKAPPQPDSTATAA